MLRAPSGTSGCGRPGVGHEPEHVPNSACDWEEHGGLWMLYLLDSLLAYTGTRDLTCCGSPARIADELDDSVDLLHLY